jgi:hypothetical protein
MTIHTSLTRVLMLPNCNRQGAIPHLSRNSRKQGNIRYHSVSMKAWFSDAANLFMLKAYIVRYTTDTLSKPKKYARMGLEIDSQEADDILRILFTSGKSLESAICGWWRFSHRLHPDESCGLQFNTQNVPQKRVQATPTDHLEGAINQPPECPLSTTRVQESVADTDITKEQVLRSYLHQIGKF